MTRLLLLGALVTACGLATACDDSVVTPIEEDGGDPTVDAGARGDGGDDVDAGPTGMDDAGSVPPRAARLVVADATGLSVFEVEAIAEGASPSPDVSIPLADGATDLARAGDRLFVAVGGGADSVVYFDEAWAMGAGATPSGSLPASAIGDPIAATRVNGLGIAGPDLWINAGLGGIHRFAGAAAGAPATSPTAIFDHMWDQLEGYAHHPGSDRLFAGQISGAGIQVYESVSGSSGEATPDFALDESCAAWSMEIAASRLVASCSPGGPGPMTIRIWDDVASLAAPRAADVVLEVDEGSGGLGIWDLLVAGDALYVATSSGLRVWRGFAALDAARVEDERVDVGSLRRLAYASDGTVFGLAPSLAGSTVTVIRDAATAPVVWATLSGFDAPGDVEILE